MSTATRAPHATELPRTRSWWAKETRIGSYVYPLRAMVVTAVAGATIAVVSVVGAVALLAH